MSNVNPNGEKTPIKPPKTSKEIFKNKRVEDASKGKDKKIQKTPKVLTSSASLPERPTFIQTKFLGQKQPKTRMLDKLLSMSYSLDILKSQFWGSSSNSIMLFDETTDKIIFKNQEEITEEEWKVSYNKIIGIAIF